MRTLLIIGILLVPALSWSQPVIRVGAKHFNEGYLLSEMIAQVLEDAGYKVDRRFNLGGTTVCFEALHVGAIDVYPEYSGTLSREILQTDSELTPEEMNDQLGSRFNLQASGTFGFSNSYGLLIRQDTKARLGIRTISDLAKHDALRIGLSYEFLERKDGWAFLSKHYGLPQKAVGLEHGLAYRALLNIEIDVTDAYTTDGEISEYQLVLLEDDRRFFPAYDAVCLYNAGLADSTKRHLQKLRGILTESDMQKLNAMALFQKQTHYEIARSYLVQHGLIQTGLSREKSPIQQVIEKSWQHIQLSFLALLASIAIALPLGLLIFRNGRLARTVLYLTGILQTIHSMALLALLIPLSGIGTKTAVIALFLYALLPILRNTVIGLSTVDPVLRKVAAAIGLRPLARLRHVEFPLALPMIIGGIRTAAAINIGTATLAAFIGAGGLGEFIVTGLALNQTSLILMGAIPAAVLAIVTELLFEYIETLVIPAHLRERKLPA